MVPFYTPTRSKLKLSGGAGSSPSTMLLRSRTDWNLHHGKVSIWTAWRTGGPMISGEITIRVRYAETDRMGLLHHANYLVYFEQARTELLRDLGLTYKDMEDAGFLLVLTKVEVRYKRPARYDDLLTIR